jgi:hypothetical protein
MDGYVPLSQRSGTSYIPKTSVMLDRQIIGERAEEINFA